MSSNSTLRISKRPAIVQNLSYMIQVSIHNTHLHYTTGFEAKFGIGTIPSRSLVAQMVRVSD